MGPAEYPARAVDPAKYLAEYILTGGSCEYQRSPVHPASIRPEQLASLNADGHLESKFLGCAGICCNGCNLVSVEGGDCSKRSNFLFSFFLAHELHMSYAVEIH